MKFKLFFLTAVGLLLLLFSYNLFADEDILWQNSAYGSKVFFNSSGDVLAVSDNNGHVSLINSKTGEISKTFYTTSEPSSQKFSHNGKIFAFSPFNNGIIFINAETLDTIRKSKIKSLYFDFSVDDNYFITANLSVAGIFINKYNINTDSLISKFTYLFSPNKDDIWMFDFAVSPTGKNIAFAGNEIFGMNNGVSYNKIINLDNNAFIGDFATTDFKLKYSSTGILATIDSGKIKFYDEKAKLIKTLKDSNYVFHDFCFNEPANEIITSSNSCGIRVWDFNTLKLKSWYQNPKFTFDVWEMGFSKEKQILAVRANLFYGLDYSYIVGIKDNDFFLPIIQIVPNPTVNQVSINIQKENIMNINLSISDLTGKRIMSKDYLNINSNTFNTSISTSNLPSGTLFFNLTIDGKLFTKQVIIIK